MLDYKLKFICRECNKAFIFYVENRGFKIIDKETYIVVHESNKHIMCPFCDCVIPQKQWRSGLLSCIYVNVPNLTDIGNEC